MKNDYLRVFKALSDAKRLRVLELLLDGEKCACILLEDLNISQPTLSHHMKILCNSGIVTGRPVGKWVYYSINDSGCEYAKELLTHLVESKAERQKSLIGQLPGGIAFPFRRGLRALFMPRVLRWLNLLENGGKIMPGDDTGCQCQYTR
jgi:ArsR family transcriptional regulator